MVNGTKMNYKLDQELMEFLSKIPNINLGGCGIAAYVLAKKFYIDYGIELTFSYIDDSKNHHTSNSISIQSNIVDKVYSPYHIVIKLEDKLYDCDGEVILSEILDQDEDINYLLENVPLWFLLETIKNAKWCLAFDRKSQIPVIEEYTGINLSQFI